MRLENDAACAAEQLTRELGPQPIARALGEHAEPQVAEVLLDDEVEITRPDELVGDNRATADPAGR